MKKIKILFVYSNLNQGGIQRVLQLLSEEFSKRKNYEVYLALFDNTQVVPFYGEIIDIKAPTTKNPFLLFLNIIKRVRRINKIVKEKEIDVIISHAEITNLFTLVSKKIYKFKPPIIATYHTNFKESAKKMGIFDLIARRYNVKFQYVADKILCVSKGMENQLADNGFDRVKLTTICNPVSIDSIDSMSKQRINSEHEFIFDKNFKIIISAGRLVGSKNFQLLLESYMEINKNIKCRLIILGEGPERSELEKLIIDNNQQENIYLLGWQENPYKYINQSNLFVLSSNYEGFPMIVLEALACNIPVISTDCPFGPNEMIQSNINGILVPVNNKSELSKAISTVLSDKSYAKKLSSKGKQRALDFSVDKIASQYEKLIDEVLEIC